MESNVVPITPISGLQDSNELKDSKFPDKKLKIVIYSTQVIPTNPDLDEYGGLELIAGLQSKYLDEIGHEVHLFGCKGSWKPPNGHLYIVGDKGTNPVAAWKAYWDDPRTRKVLKDADLVCDHSWDFYCYSEYNELKHLCHPWHGPDPGFRQKPPHDKPNLIGISFSHSKHMMKMAPDTVWRTVHNGIPLYKYKFNSKPIAERERLFWLSRLYYPKGCHRAIEIANNLKMPIDIAGGSFGQVPEYEAYVKKMCEESPYATFHGPISFAKKLELYRSAKCVILPIIEKIPVEDGKKYMGLQGNWDWIEPFGLVVAEAGAAGCPTIVTPNGGWVESLIHGYNGFFANTDREFEYYVKQVDTLKPENCRKRAEDFDYKIMGANYLKLFKEIISNGGW